MHPGLHSLTLPLPCLPRLQSTDNTEAATTANATVFDHCAGGKLLCHLQVGSYAGPHQAHAGGPMADCPSLHYSHVAVGESFAGLDGAGPASAEPPRHSCLALIDMIPGSPARGIGGEGRQGGRQASYAISGDLSRVGGPCGVAM